LTLWVETTVPANSTITDCSIINFNSVNGTITCQTAPLTYLTAVNPEFIVTVSIWSAGSADYNSSSLFYGTSSAVAASSSSTGIIAVETSSSSSSVAIIITGVLIPVAVILLITVFMLYRNYPMYSKYCKAKGILPKNNSSEVVEKEVADSEVNLVEKSTI